MFGRDCIEYLADEHNKKGNRVYCPVYKKDIEDLNKDTGHLDGRAIAIMDVSRGPTLAQAYAQAL